MDKLLPCPFCGKQPKLLQDYRWPGNAMMAIRAYHVVCVNHDCVIYGADNIYFRSADKAIKAWNKRECEAERKKGKWTDLNALHPNYATCSECGFMEEFAYENNFCPMCGADMREEGRTDG